MNARGFAILMVFAVAASVVIGLVVERFTAPGFERTLWFAIGLAAVIFPAGRFAEKRGWINGFWHGGPQTQQGPSTSASSTSPSPSATSSAAPQVTAASTSDTPPVETDSSATRLRSGDSR